MFKISFILKLTAALNASNIIYVEWKKKMIEWTKTHSNNSYGHYETTNQRT